MDKPSPWALAPPRDVDKLPTEDSEFYDSTVKEAPTFVPELISSPDLREKAKSSGYGKVIATPPKPPQKPEEPEPPFAPQLPPDPKRELAHSHGYGKVLAEAPKPKEEQLPPFKPEIKRQSYSDQIFKGAKSSAYGKVTAQAPRPKSAPTSPFKPQMPPSKLRESAASHAYGKVVPQSRPTTANADSRGPGAIKAKYVPRYSLHADHSDRQAEKSTPSTPTGSKDFILDGVYANLARPRFVDTFGFSEFKLSPQQKELRAKSASHQYGVASPQRKPRPEPKPSEPHFKFGVGKSALDEPLPPHPPKTPLADKATSHGYGKVAPPVAPKPEPKPAEPKWNMTYKAEVPTELPPAPRSIINDKVGSHGYGTLSPPKAPRYKIEPEPLWIPTNNPSVKKPDPPSYPLRGKVAHNVRSHYGKDYDPTSLYGFNGTGEFDEGENVAKSVHRSSNGNHAVDADTDAEMH